MDKSEFKSLCAQFQKETDRKKRRIIGLRFRELIGHRVNEHGVFTLPKVAPVIEHSRLKIYIDYVETPVGLLAAFDYYVHMHEGGSGPVTIQQVMSGQFVTDLRTFARERVQRLLDRGKDFPAPVINMLNRYLKQTEQIDLFDDEVVPKLKQYKTK